MLARTDQSRKPGLKSYLCLSKYGLFLPGCSALVGCEDAARISLLNILTARGEIDLEKLKFAVYDFTSMYTKFTHKMIMTQMTKLLTWQRYISSRCVVFPTSFLQRRAEQRRVFALPCVHPRAGRQCIALTKRKRVVRRCCGRNADEVALFGAT